MNQRTEVPSRNESSGDAATSLPRPSRAEGYVGHALPQGFVAGMPSEKGYALEVHSELDALGRLESAWRGLVSPEAPPFQTYAWNLAWYRTYSGGRLQPLVFEMRQGDRTVAILPCYRDGRTLRLAGDRICDYQDAIASDPLAVEALVAALRDWLDGEGRGCSFRFEKLSEEGVLFSVLQDAERASSKLLKFVKSYAPCPYVDLRGGLEPLLASMPRKRRQDQRRALNRLRREAPEAQVTILRESEIRVADLWNAATFHIEHFRKRGESPFKDHRLIDFFARIAAEPEVGMQLGFLTLKDQLLAVDFGFVRRGRYYGLLTAFDSARARLAPGKCLLLKRIDRWVGEDGVDTLDFLAGDERYKRRYAGAVDYRVWSMHLMRDDLMGRMRQAGLESNRLVRQVAKRALVRDDGLAR